MIPTFTDERLRDLIDDLRAGDTTSPPVMDAAAAIEYLMGDRERIAKAIEEISAAGVASGGKTAWWAAGEMQRLAAEAARTGGSPL